jgi:hypothetical protein
MFQFLCVSLGLKAPMLGLERQLNLVALLALVPAVMPDLTKGFPARAQIVVKLFHLKMLQSRSHHDLRLRKMTGFPLLSHMK